MGKPVVRFVVLPAFAALGSTFHIEGEVYFGDTDVARIDEASGYYRGARRWFMGARFELLLGEVETKRLKAEMIAKAKSGSVGQLIDHVKALP